MGRLRPDFVVRVDDLSVRILDVASELERSRASRRVVDQIIGCGTAVGANLAEAEEAVSAPDFFKCASIALKELNEARYWLRIIARKEWIKPVRLRPLATEADELKRILGAIVSARRRATRPSMPV
jgi:four helix bundle protein